jgi:hypothetical protein
MNLKNLYIILFTCLLVACSPTTINLPTSASTGNLPDLVVDSINVGMVDANGRCLNGYYVQARILNQGNAPAEGVVAMEGSTGQQVTLSRLDAGESADIRIPAGSSKGAYLINVDPLNVIPESNETNNNLSFLLPIPTPFAGCATSSDSATPLPPTLPRYAHALDGLIYANMDSAQIFRIISGGQGVAVLQGTFARFSPDSILALFESSGDIFLAEPMDNPGINLTKTPDRLESNPQWLPLNTLKVVFNSKGINEAQEKGWGNDVLGYLSMVNMDGSEYTVLADVPSYTAPALISDGRMIAYEQSGMPMLYEIGKGSRPFDPTLYGYQPSAEAVFTSPSFSPFGLWLTWWVSENSSQLDKQFSLVLFDLNANTSTTLHSYTPLAGTSGWFPNPVWSPSGQWVAFQTRSETTPWDLWVMHQGGGIGQRFGLASNPVWSPDSQYLAYLQNQPRTSDLPSILSIIDVPSWNVQPTNLPAGSIPLGWTLLALLNPSYFPRFTAPADWLTYSNANPAYQIKYPPSAKLDSFPERLTINLLNQPSNQTTNKSITIETRADTIDNCYAFSAWDGKTVLNGVDLNYYGGKRFETGSNGVEFLIGYYAAYHNGFCFTIQSRMTMSSNSDLAGENMDPETLLNIISTLTLY